MIKSDPRVVIGEPMARISKYKLKPELARKLEEQIRQSEIRS